MSKPLKKSLFKAIVSLIETAKGETAVYVNAKISLLYWNIGSMINKELLQHKRATYGTEILATLSQELTQSYGRGYSYSALTRMSKIAACFTEQNIATLSQQFSYSHLIEFVAIEEEVKRTFYMQLAAEGNWSLRQLRAQMDKMLFERTAIAKKPAKQIAEAIVKHQEKPQADLIFKTSYVLDFLNLPQFFTEEELEKALLDNLQQFIMELGNGFTFVERQKRIPVDAVDYHLDLLFYHRKLKRLIAIDLKLGKFKPEYKGQMELYLKWLRKNEMQQGEETPLGLLLCSEGNTEHIELLMLDEDEIKVAQYLTGLPSKKWFIEKLHRSIEIAKRINENKQ